MRSAHHYTSKQLFAVFWPYLRPHSGRIVLAILALVLIASALLGMGRGLAYLVDEGLGKRDPVLLDRAVMATVLIAVVLAFGSYLRASMVNKNSPPDVCQHHLANFIHHACAEIAAKCKNNGNQNSCHHRTIK